MVNPANLPSRGLSFEEIQKSQLWLHGPTRLMNEVDVQSTEPIPLECLKELRVKDRELLALNVSEHSKNGIGAIMSVERFSSFERLIGSTAILLSFLGILKSKLRRSNDVASMEELKREAEDLWIRDVQEKLIKSEWKGQFDLFLDENKLWRCGGRIGNAGLSYDVLHPILLPKGHWFTLLVVRRAHQRVGHSGVKDTLTEVRSRYWIPQGRSFVRQYIRRCVVCRRYNASSYKSPSAPPLPESRVQQSFPFSAVGVDYAGPLWIKQNTYISNSATRRRTPYSHILCVGKVWVCLFTCCVTRAVHIDIVSDFSSYCFLQCFKRFIARRGLPARVISDNGSTFKSAAKTL
uniref:Integrase zinc-binding domain-containing protein n=1 Tax=Amphimedon queenslandica TaxID=400682 RepID=A0A1X7VS76_AMPQE